MHPLIDLLKNRSTQHCHRGLGRRPQADRQHGFAIVIALSLMAFVLLLLLSITTLVRVETGSAAQQSKILLAEQNALLALNMALGDIQKYTGPDQRATATADILEAPNVGNAGTLPTDAYGHKWTGVWAFDDADSDTAVGNDERQQLAWLISTPNDTTATQASYTNSEPIDPATGRFTGNSTLLNPDGSTASEKQAIMLSASSTTDEFVAVPIREIDPVRPEGGVAWWVADEGVKAPFSPGPELGSPTVLDSIRAISTSSRAAIENIDGGVFGYDPSDSSHRDAFDKVFSEFQIPLLTAFGGTSAALKTASQDHYHNITFHSKGVISDTLRGGLKKDLTALLGDDSLFNSEFGSMSSSMFPSGSQSTPEYYKHFMFVKPTAETDNEGAVAIGGFNFVGPSWSIIKEFYQYYEQTNGDTNSTMDVIHMFAPRGNAYPVSNEVGDLYDNPNSDPYYRYSTNSSARNITAGRATHGLIPIITRFEVVNAFGAEINGSQYIPRLYQQVYVTMANPYNVTLDLNSYRIEAQQLGFTMTLKFIDGNGSRADYPVQKSYSDWLKESKNWGSVNGWDKLILDVVNASFAPGEVKAFSFDRVEAFTRISDPTGSEASIGILEPGIRTFDEGNRYFELMDLAELLPFDADPSVQQWSDYNNNSDLLEIVVNPSSTGTRMNFSVQNLTFALDNNQNVYKHDMLSFDFATPDMTGDAEFPNGGASGSFDATFLDQVLNFKNNPSTPGADSVFWYSFKMGMRLPDDKPEGTVDNSEISIYTHYNPRARYPTYRQANYFSDFQNPTYFSRVDSGGFTTAGPSNNAGQPFWGASEQFSSGQSNVILYHIPRQPLVSLGQLQHVNIGIYANEPNYIIGNSWADVGIEAGDIFGNPAPSNSPSQGMDAVLPGNYKRLTVDLPYLLNETLFDRYYFSTVPFNGLPASFSYNTAFNQSYIDDGSPLPNPRFSYYGEPTLANLRDPSESAANLMIDGAFNINSTSVEAWTAVLSGLNTLEVQTLSGSSAQTNPISRLSLSGSGINSSNSSSTPEAWKSARSYTTAEIDSLASEIVNQIKLRGPFVSMADFINRSLEDREPGGSEPDTRISGALQAAIDASGINGTGTDNTAVPSPTANGMLFPEVAESGYTKDGRTGALIQGDIATLIAPFANARSDTFKIRAMGYTTDPISGETEVARWCEAVVQRIPEYVDNSDAPSTVPSSDQLLTRNLATPPSYSQDLLTSINQAFGRRYVVRSFRWLAEDEI